MVAKTPTIARPAATAERRALPDRRILGLAGMLGSPFLFLSFAANGFAQGDSNRAGAALGFLFSLGWLASILGLRNLDAAGRRLPARILLGIETLTVALATLFQIYEFVAPGSQSLLYTITDISWPLSMLLLLVTGIAAVFARVLDGWLRFVPLFAALWLPLSIVEQPILGPTLAGAVGGLHTAIGWFLLGYVVYRGGTLAARS